LREIGYLMLLVGAISTAFKLLKVGMVHLLLVWVDNWGPGVGWAIRIGVMAAGALLVALSYRRKKAVPGGTPQPPPPGRI